MQEKLIITFCHSSPLLLHIALYCWLYSIDDENMNIILFLMTSV